MRRLFLALLAGVALMGLRLLQLDGEHIYSGKDSFYTFVSGLGMFLLFLAFLSFVIVSMYVSQKLSIKHAFLTGVVVLVAGVAAWKIVFPMLNVHAWTLALIAIPF